MKIAIFTDMYLEAAGGIPAVVKASKQEFEKRGHRVVVFCPGITSGGEKGVVLVPTSWMRIAGAPMAKSVRAVEKFIKSGKWKEQLGGEAVEISGEGLAGFDVVHVHYELATSIAGAKLARKYGVRLVQTMHGREDRAVEVNLPKGLRLILAIMMNGHHRKFLPHEVRAEEILAKNLPYAGNRLRAEMWELMVGQANFADAVIAPSEHFARKLQVAGVTRPMVAIPSGVSETVLAEQVVQRSWDGQSELVIIWNSRVSREKRLPAVIEGLALAGVRARLMVYGDGNDLRRAKRLVRKLGLLKQVEFFGQRPRAEILKAMKAAELAVVASVDFDTQGMTLVEAQAMGLPTLFCDPDMAEVVPKGGGILTGSPAPEAIAAVLKDLARAPEKIADMSRVMIEVRAGVTMARAVDKLLKVYKK